MTTAETTTGKQRGRPFQKGRSANPAGRPKGARNHATVIAESLLDSEAGSLMRKAIDLAMSGDTIALRLCIERILPARRDRPVSIELPTLGSAGDAVKAMAAITEAVAKSELTPSEAGDLSSLVLNYVKAIETSELEKRIAAIEQRAEGQTRR